jgi:hypothetical protein
VSGVFIKHSRKQYVSEERVSQMIDPVKAEWFYKSEEEKTKLNWFCYEYANVIYVKIMDSKKLAKYRNGHSKKEISGFCLHFSKAMKRSINNRMRGLEDAVIVDDRYVYEFYPMISPSNAKGLLLAANKAWEKMALACEGCRHRCLMEGDAHTGMFDSLRLSEWP